MPKIPMGSFPEKPQPPFCVVPNPRVLNSQDLASPGKRHSSTIRWIFPCVETALPKLTGGRSLGEAALEMRALGYRIADHSGEQYWFKQSALANLRLIRGRSDFQDIWSPAEFIGNVGAAVVPLMIGMAFTAAAKGYASGDPVLVESSNDKGACGAAVFRRRMRT
jgi:hypothetical protein